MQMQALRCRIAPFVAGVLILVCSGWAYADPPSRVARLGYASGAVSLSPAGEDDWDSATINRPLSSGDRLWTEDGARAEIQIGGAVIRMNGATGASILNLDDRIAQLQLTQGTLNVRVRRLDPGQLFEVDTPNLAFTLRKPGAYRISVDDDGTATSIVVRQGQGEAYGEGEAYTIDARQAYRFTGTGLRDYDYLDVPGRDEFDRWASDRDRRYDSSASAHYVSPDVVGYQDLDANGNWLDDARYGKVWVPNRVAADWAPYRDGHWAWVDPWGWTWIDDAPWGFAVSHYGRWARLRDSWGWVPGPARGRAYYAPAVVAFVGGSNFQLTVSSGSVGGVAWFPLAPREVYRPAYPVSRAYFEKLNRSNTVINTTIINKTYINKTTNIVYANRQVPGAIVAVPTTTFVQSQPVARAAQRPPRERMTGAAIAAAPSVAPTERSVRGRAEAQGKPPPRVFERPVIAHSTPRAAHPGFAAQQQRLADQPGKPLDEATRRELKPPATRPAPVIKVLAPTQEGRARPAPPATAKSGTGDRRGQPDARPAAVAPGVAVTPPANAAPAAAPAPAAESTRGRAAERGNASPRGKTAAPPAPAAGLASPSQAVSAPAAPVPEQRGKPVPVKPPEATPPQNAAPAKTVSPPDARGKPEQRPPEPKITPTTPAPAPAAAPETRTRPKPNAPAVAPSAQKPAERRAAPPHAAAPASTQPREAAALRAAPSAPVTAPTPVQPARQAEPRPPAAAPVAPPQAAPSTQESKPDAAKPNERGGDKRKREEEARKNEK